MSENNGYFLEGYSAYKEGFGMGENPYDPGLQLDEHDEWLEGWFAADVDHREESS